MVSRQPRAKGLTNMDPTGREYILTRPLKHLLEFHKDYFVNPGRCRDIMMLSGSDKFKKMEEDLLECIEERRVSFAAEIASQEKLRAELAEKYGIDV